MNWIAICFRKYANFSGRAQRSEYWYFLLFLVVLYLVLSVLDGLVGTYSSKNEIGLLSSLFLLGTLVPALSVASRRLHDIGKSGWWQLLNLVPFVGFVILLFWLARDGSTGENMYGKNPKTAT